MKNLNFDNDKNLHQAAIKLRKMVVSCVELGFLLNKPISCIIIHGYSGYIFMTIWLVGGRVVCSLNCGNLGRGLPAGLLPLKHARVGCA